MSLPETLAARLEDEEAVATVPLGGDDRLVVTPSRTLVYRAEGLLSDESIEEYPHGAERIEASKGRRKAKVVLDYGLDGERTVSIPTKRLDDALHPILAGTLSAAEITDPGESALRTFRFSELTLVVTSRRVVKHIGASVWDGDYEEFHYDDVTDLGFEEGSVATSVVLTVDGRQERFKAPNERARAVRETLVDALCDYYDVSSLEEFRLTVAPEEDEAEDVSDPTDFGEGPDPLSAEPAAGDADADRLEEVGTAATAESEPESAADVGAFGGDHDDGGADSGSVPGGHAGGTPETESAVETGPNAGGELTADNSLVDRDDVAKSPDPDDGFEGTFEPATAENGELDELVEELAGDVDALRRTVERQGERLDRQSQLIEQLIEELRRGR